MARFRYKAKNGPKAVMTGTIDAENEHAALMKLSSMGYYPLSVEKEDISGSTSGMGVLPFMNRVPTKDLSLLTRQRMCYKARPCVIAFVLGKLWQGHTCMEPLRGPFNRTHYRKQCY
jgi:hypothetical protein